MTDFDTSLSKPQDKKSENQIFKLKCRRLNMDKLLTIGFSMEMENLNLLLKMHSFLFCITFQTRNKTIKLVFSFKSEEIQIQLCQPVNSVNSHPFCNNSYFWTIFFKTGHILLSVSDVPTKLNFKWCEAVQPPLKKGDKFNVSHFLSRTQWDKIFSRGATISTKPFSWGISLKFHTYR